MKTINNWRDLEPYGVKALTGEACGLAMRLLCDLTEDGVRLIREFFGIPAENPFDDNMNSGAVASILLPTRVLPDLAAFVLIKSGCVIAYHIRDEGVWGCETETESADAMVEVKLHRMGEVVRQYRPAGSYSDRTRCHRAL